MYINIYKIYNTIFKKYIKHNINILTFATFQQPYVAEEDISENNIWSIVICNFYPSFAFLETEIKY